MMTINQVCKLTGVSRRTLQYYDEIGLLKPKEYTQAGYRLYDETALEKLQQILLFKEIEFSLKEIKDIIDAPDFDRNKALEQQIELLTIKKNHFDNLIDFARKIRTTGVTKMDYSVFDKNQISEYSKKAKEQWGHTAEYKEYEEKTENLSSNDQKVLFEKMMLIFAEFGKLTDKNPNDDIVQSKVKELQDYISQNFYYCSNEILQSLGEMYSSGGDFTNNIDKFGGTGTAVFVAKAIDEYCRK